MWRKVQRFMDENGMPWNGGRIIVALSGGADSVCLLTILHRIQKSAEELGAQRGETHGSPNSGSLMGLQLRAVHVHHGLRGAEADRDVQFVQKLCEQLKLPLTVVYRDVITYAAEHGMSTEEAGRFLRYEAFSQEAKRWEQELSMQEAEHGRQDPDVSVNRICIALAHHRDDHAETILHHLLRGSGLKGLSGIRPVQGSRIRPLLCVSRAEILDYLNQEGLSWCEDSTNERDDYTRNRIRNQLIPQMTKHINQKAVENIIHAGEIFAQADRYLEKQAMAVWGQAGRADSSLPDPTGDDGSQMSEYGAADAKHERQVSRSSISLTAFRAQEPIIQTYLIRHMLDLVTPGWKDITSGHFQQIAELAGKQVGKRMDLPCEMQAVCDYENLILERTSRSSREMKDLPMSEKDLKIRTFSRKKGEEIPKNQYTKWFDYDKIKNTLFLRTRQTGDYLTLPGGGRKAVTRYMIDEKIPREQRDTIPVLAEGSHVLWVVGFRISEYYKVTDTTKTILEVEFDGGKKDGREYSCVTV